MRKPKVALILSLLSIVSFIEMLDVTILNVTIPRIATELGTDVLDLKMAITCYLVALAVRAAPWPRP